MAAAQGVQTTAHYILPFIPKIKTPFSLSYQLDLSDKGKQKLKSYEMYKLKKLTMQEIASIFEVDKSTISRWVSQVKNAKRNRRYQMVEPKSRRPNKTPRQMVITKEVKDLILKIRGEYKCGKEKISAYLDRDYDIKVHPSTIQRFLNTLKQSDDPMWWNKNKVKCRRKKIKKIRIKDVVNEIEGRAFEHFQIDTKYWVINGHTFYVVTAIDLVTRMMFARAYAGHSSKCAQDFLERLDFVYQLKDTKVYIQRDNGSEFMGFFEKLADKFGITLITNYARRPQMNGYIERFNRSLKDELLEYVLPMTVFEANEYIRDYVIRYNFDRIHSGIGQTPFEKFCESTFKKPFKTLLQTHFDLLHMYRTSTIN